MPYLSSTFFVVVLSFFLGCFAVSFQRYVSYAPSFTAIRHLLRLPAVLAK